MSDAVAPSGDASGDASAGTRVTQRRWWWSKPARNALKIVAIFFVFYFFILPLIPGFRRAVHDLQKVNPALLVLGLTLELAALGAYSMLTRAALPRDSVSVGRMLRIQLSTRALASVVPGGSAAGSALGYRLLTLSGVDGPDAGFALATAGLGSAVVLNIIFWTGLLVSIPVRGVNPFYGTAAIIGLILVTLLMFLVIGLLKGQARAERILRSLARRFRFDEDHAAAVVRQLAARLRDLASDPKLLSGVIGWATANWLLDVAALWVFLRAFGGSVPLDGLIVAFGLANILCSFPITPGGLGIVEGIYIPTLVGFGLSRSVATLGVISYRLAQYWLPILLGALAYLSLRVGPWSIARRDRLERLRVLAKDETEIFESGLEWAERYGHRPTDPTVPVERGAGGEDDLR
jgi:putative heme transporter